MRVSSISDKFYSMLGLCQRAGKLVSGGMLCENSIRSGKAQMVIVSNEASEGTLEKFTNLCRYYNTELVIAGQKEQLGHAIGKFSRTVLVVLDKVFKEMLTNLLNQNEIQHGGDQ